MRRADGPPTPRSTISRRPAPVCVTMSAVRIRISGGGPTRPRLDPAGPEGPSACRRRWSPAVHPVRAQSRTLSDDGLGPGLIRCWQPAAQEGHWPTLAREERLAGEATVEPPDLARLGRLREVPGRLEGAAETFDAAHMPADALRNWPRKHGFKDELGVRTELHF